MNGQSIKSALWGCLEIPLFMKLGVTRFNNTKDAAISSFIIPFLSVFLIAELAHINPVFADRPYIWNLFSLTALLVINIVLFYGASYICMWALDRKEFIYTYINATNWLSLTVTLTNLPFILLVYFGFYTYAEMNNLFIFMILFGCTYQAFYITHALRINWMLGTAISILGMLIDDTAYKIMFGGF